MTGVVIGKVLDVNLDGVIIEDHVTKEKITAISESDDVLEMKIGETAIFVGNLYGNTIRVKRYEIRKFLDPLYEQDLFDASGRYSLIPPVDNPFTDAFVEFMEKRKVQELEAKEAQLATLEVDTEGEEENTDDESD